MLRMAPTNQRYNEGLFTINVTISSWLVVDLPSDKYEFVSWDDEIPNWMEKIKTMFQTTNQLVIL